MSAMTKDKLSNELDAFYLMLLEEAKTPTKEGDDQPDDGPPSIGFLDRLRLFSEGVRWAAVKSRVEPDDASDEFGRLRAGHVRGAGGGGRSRAASPRPNGSGTP